MRGNEVMVMEIMMGNLEVMGRSWWNKGMVMGEDEGEQGNGDEETQGKRR